MNRLQDMDAPVLLHACGTLQARDPVLCSEILVVCSGAACLHSALSSLPRLMQQA